MAGNTFEDSRVAAGILGRGGQKPGNDATIVEKSKSISRDDIRDGIREEAMRVLSARILNNWRSCARRGG